MGSSSFVVLLAVAGVLQPRPEFWTWQGILFALGLASVAFSFKVPR
jgi:hypothetical protein